MKFTLALLLLWISCTAYAQQQLPVIHARSKTALIIEGDDDRYGWNLSPQLKPDIHTINKSPGSKLVRFYTDIDSIRVQLRPGAHFDFIVLLAGKDSCYTRLQSLPLKNHAATLPDSHDTLSFVLTPFNNIKIKAVLNGQDTLDLKFDSGTTGLLLTHEAIRNKGGTANTRQARNTLQIGNLRWDSLLVYPVALSGQGTDGRFGWDLFDGKIVEIDYDRRLFIVHTRLPETGRDYARLDMEYTHTLFCIPGELQVKNRKYKNRFLFDNGYQRTVMLDTVLMNEQQYPRDLEIIRKVVMRNGQGAEIPVLTVNNERLNLGQLSLFDIPAQLLTRENPAGFKTHILGNEVLKRFNTLLDFQGNAVYLKPNSLYDRPYTDAR